MSIVYCSGQGPLGRLRDLPFKIRMEESEGVTSYERQGVATGSQVRVGDWFLKIFCTITSTWFSSPVQSCS
ncbi:hypothetical protein M404DRAFT_999227 [Pisolithus tinctorius Marx 270]|uniref:Uncharacterized protein n=1 Tax=Pisolithus tinctorius Marx 270 TaxID=870435 RepID=A0A0C3I7U2_PISTI|nr:hypothetical protein M404DRAFT_1009118 [Pisolithus tinctorius Marx 270]KIO06000.1 hypothetical protein M404DRAFT_999227 [Pisolithus tinctorius Marx 270]